MSFPRHITWTWLAQVQVSRNSLAPFLYQTHTLTPIQSRSLRVQSRPFSSAASYNQVGNDEPPRSPGDNLDETNSSAESAPARPTSFIRKKAADVANLAHREPGTESPYIKEPDTEAGRRPKLTTHEARTLANLASQLDPKNGQAPGEPMREPEIVSMRRAEQNERKEISAIFDAVLQDVQNRQNPSERRTEQEVEDEDFKAKCQKEESPPVVELQGKFHFLPDTDEKLGRVIDAGEMTLAEALELLIKRETAKIDTALHAAVDEGEDAIFWDLCLEKVFSLAQHIGSTRETASVLKELEPLADNHDPQEVQQTAIESPLEAPAQVPIEAVAAGVYPRVLRTAFVLLNLHFPGSPLISQFRQKINSLGRESAALGLSTNLYNDMLYFHWRVSHDFSQIVDIGREMELTGVNPDHSTINILEGIARERSRDLKRRRLGIVSAQPWWNMPTNRKALRELLGEEEGEKGLVRRLSDLYREKRKRRDIFKPYL
ncbi:hypothetical protein BDW62DRAFT_15860 [Aspergillus aurantiobrunneus]